MQRFFNVFTTRKVVLHYLNHQDKVCSQSHGLKMRGTRRLAFQGLALALAAPSTTAFYFAAQAPTYRSYGTSRAAVTTVMMAASQDPPPAKLELPRAKIEAVEANKRQWGITVRACSEHECMHMYKALSCLPPHRTHNPHALAKHHRHFRLRLEPQKWRQQCRRPRNSQSGRPRQEMQALPSGSVRGSPPASAALQTPPWPSASDWALGWALGESILPRPLADLQRRRDLQGRLRKL